MKSPRQTDLVNGYFPHRKEITRDISMTNCTSTYDKYSCSCE